MADADGGRRNLVRDLSWFAAFLVFGVFVGLGVRSLGTRESARPDSDRDPAPATDHSLHAAPPPAPPAPTGEGFVVDLGNETCPILKGPVNGKAFVVWNGVRVGLCCPPCSKELLEAPERRLDEAGIEWRPAVEVAAALNGASDEERPGLLSEAKKGFHVLEPSGEGRR